MSKPRVSEYHKKMARRVPIADFISASQWAAEYKKDGINEYRSIKHSSLVVTNKGYQHFATGETGNGIDLLTKYHGCSFVEAVKLLCAFSGLSATDADAAAAGELSADANTDIVTFQLPERASDCRRVFAYLIKKRHIDAELVKALVRDKILYQTAERGNCCYVSADGDFAAIEGTGDTRFKGIAAGSKTDGFWSFGVHQSGVKVYVCESAVDAMSLYTYQKNYCAAHNCPLSPAVYVSMFGLKPEVLKAVRAAYPDAEVVLCVDNDKGGDTCCSKFPDLRRLRPPTGKDWNDCLA